MPSLSLPDCVLVLSTLCKQDNVAVESSIRPFSFRAELIKASGLIAWDELPAANVAWMDCVDRVCRTIMQTDAPFGGIPFLGIGDFRQVAPVVKGSGCTSARLACVKASSLWPLFSVLTLHAPIRSARDPLYTAFVDRIGEDYVSPTVSLDHLMTVASLTDCIQFLFPADILLDPLACLKRAFLSPKNTPVDEFNMRVLDRLPGDECKPPLRLPPLVFANCATSLRRHVLQCRFNQGGLGGGRRRPTTRFSRASNTLGCSGPSASTQNWMRVFRHAELICSEGTCEERQSNCKVTAPSIHTSSGHQQS